MFKLLRYDILGRYKFFLSVAGMLALLNLFLVIGFYVIWPDIMPAQAVLAFMGMGGLIAVSIIFIDGINMLRNDLYNETGYLTLTLPQKSSAILGARLILSQLQVLLMSLIVLLLIIVSGIVTGAIRFDTLEPSQLGRILQRLVEYTPDLIFFIYMGLLGSSTFMLIIFLSIVLVKSVLPNKKLAGFSAFIVFIVLSIVLQIAADGVSKVFPQSFTPSHIKIGGGNIFFTYFSSSGVNIASVLLSTIIPVLLFIATAYLMERKVDL